MVQIVRLTTRPLAFICVVACAVACSGGNEDPAMDASPDASALDARASDAGSAERGSSDLPPQTPYPRPFVVDPNPDRKYRVSAGARHLSRNRAPSSQISRLYFNAYYVGYRNRQFTISFQAAGDTAGTYHIGYSFRNPDLTYSGTSWLTSELGFASKGNLWIVEEQSDGQVTVKNQENGKYIVNTGSCLSSNVHSDYACLAGYGTSPTLFSLE